MTVSPAPAKALTVTPPLPWGRYALITLGLSFLALVVLFPLFNILYQAFQGGLGAYWQGISNPEARSAIFLTLLVVIVVVPVNTVFGVLVAWVLARYQFPGKVIFLGILDLPFAISPVVAGMMHVILYSPTKGILGPWLESMHIRILFAPLGVILVTLFVTLPFVAREVLPVLQELGDEEEQAAATLGASPWETFWYVTLPNIRWALLYGVILCTARALGEFGAVSVVSGKLINQTETLTLHIEQVYSEYQTVAAFACASLLTLLAVVTLVIQEFIKSKEPSTELEEKTEGV